MVVVFVFRAQGLSGPRCFCLDLEGSGGCETFHKLLASEFQALPYENKNRQLKGAMSETVWQFFGSWAAEDCEQCTVTGLSTMQTRSY